MLLKPIKCPKCGSAITGKQRDLMLQCPACDTIYMFDRELCNVTDVPYMIAAPAKEGNGTETKVYVPFWVIHADLNVMHEDISGGAIRRSIGDQKQLRGERDFYVCAADSVPEKISRIWNMDLTLGQPALTEQSGFRGALREVMTMDEASARSAAEFLFLRHETEIPGTLQRLEYNFTVRDTKVVYLPAFKSGNNFTPAV